ncbi:MAG: VOC family protein [Deltaproteobacteria bacterium]|nr:VOC family protein [Deltaproteobacteria bacterium]
MPVPLLSVMHVNVNCSKLERSLAFYRDRVGLSPLTHTNPVPQKGEGFGLEGEVQWDAHLLHDARGFAGPAVDLLEWKRPGPTGRPYADANHLGYFRLCFTHPDLAALHARLSAAGVACRSEPHDVSIDPGSGLTARFFCAADPDGSTVEFIELAGEPRMIHVNVNCSDLARSSEWYQRVLGLEVIGHSSPGPVEGRGFGLAGSVEWRADFLALPGQSEHFVIDLHEWLEPKPVGRPYAEANHLGLYRMAFLVEDAHACQEALLAEGVECGPPVWLDMGDEIPIDGVWAIFFEDPDGTCLELIQRPEIRE